MAIEVKDAYQVTTIGDDISDSGEIERTAPKSEYKDWDYSFRAYDDDDTLYFAGIIKDDDGLDIAFDDFMRGWGVTLLKFYDRGTGMYIDSMG